MAAPIVLTVNWEWREEPTDARNCGNCEDMIVSKMWRVWTVVCGEAKKTKIVVCDACKRAYDDTVS